MPQSKRKTTARRTPSRAVLVLEYNERHEGAKKEAAAIAAEITQNTGHPVTIYPIERFSLRTVLG